MLTAVAILLFLQLSLLLIEGNKVRLRPLTKDPCDKVLRKVGSTEINPLREA